MQQPVRLVLSRRLDLPKIGAACAIRWGAAALALPWRGSGAGAISISGPRRARSLSPARPGRVAMSTRLARLQELGARGLTSVFCEGGGALAASLLSAELVDRLVTFSAGLALGAEGKPAIGAMGVAALAEAPRFTLETTTPVGDDVMQVWSRARSNP